MSENKYFKMTELITKCSYWTKYNDEIKKYYVNNIIEGIDNIVMPWYCCVINDFYNFSPYYSIPNDVFISILWMSKKIIYDYLIMYNNYCLDDMKKRWEKHNSNISVCVIKNSFDYLIY